MVKVAITAGRASLVPRLDISNFQQYIQQHWAGCHGSIYTFVVG